MRKFALAILGMLVGSILGAVLMAVLGGDSSEVVATMVGFGFFGFLWARM